MHTVTRGWMSTSTANPFIHSITFHACSLALCKNLLRVGLSQVTYIRGLFAEKCFEPKEYCELRIQQLTPSTPESKLLIAWLEKGKHRDV